ncbi:hypothetical protein RhiirA5_140501 [Rhizophagus irregularis]|uniref:Uncharacterized protein n=1 Tax=Rhizophagus irregularis TaxID=588596 RepID=A0A2N0NPF4_9GLOM|nr:hypothetical protein RhiirA5_140501 [Rhizophagus irregularis]GET62915.1 hypothetical protein RIR_e15293_A0A2N0NPF4_9GLOM [Rhizophagus irregularis DAOM 181602=DAOM 197198]
MRVPASCYFFALSTTNLFLSLISLSINFLHSQLYIQYCRLSISPFSFQPT